MKNKIRRPTLNNQCFATLSGICRQVMVLFLIVSVLNGCAAPRQTAPPPSRPGSITVPPPSEFKAVTGPAAALYSEAEKALQSGRLAESELLLERALRIEPRNPYYWHTMAQVKYRQGQYSETVQFCLKAESLAGKQPQLIARNKELLRQAKKVLPQ